MPSCKVFWVLIVDLKQVRNMKFYKSQEFASKQVLVLSARTGNGGSVRERQSIQVATYQLTPTQTVTIRLLSISVLATGNMNSACQAGDKVLGMTLVDCFNRFPNRIWQ